MNRLSSEAHVVEEVNGVRCSIVEKNVSPERADFLKKLLEHNGLNVIVVPTPPPPAKPAPKPALATTGAEGQPLPPPPLPPPPPNAPSTFTVAVTNIAFHAMLAVYERSLLTPDGRTVSIAYWNQETEKEGEVYWQRRIK